MTVSQFKSKKDKFEDQVVKDVLGARAAVIVYLNNTDDGPVLGHILGKCSAAEACTLLEEARASLNFEVIQTLFTSENEDGTTH